MNQEKLDCLEKRAIDAKNHIHADIQKTKSILSDLPAFLISPKVREGVEKDQQHQLNTCALITDLIHALKEDNQPEQATSLVKLALSAKFIFPLNGTAIIKISSKEAQVIARADSAASGNSYLLHYCTHDGRAVTEWFDEGILSQLQSESETFSRVYFSFELNQSVAIGASGEEGRVISRAQYAASENDYLLHYRAADGRAVSSWFGESMISPLHEKQLTQQIHSAD